jgi:hypothetical protein
MKCRDTTRAVSEARDRALSEQELAELRDHLAGCDRCQIASRQFRILFEQLDKLLARADEAADPTAPKGRR